MSAGGIAVGIHPQLGSQGIAGEPPFAPPDIAGLMMWLDPSDTATTFQDSAGTVPATANNDPVGRIDDRSAQGNNVTASASGKRPILNTAAGLWWLEFDGTDDCLSASAFVLNATAGKATLCLAVELSTPASVGIVIERGANYNGTNGGLITYTNSDASADVGTNGPGGANAYKYTGLLASAQVITIVFNKDLSGSGAPKFTTYSNGVAVVGTEVAGNDSGGAYGSDPVFIGMRNDSSLPQAMSLYGLALYGSEVSNADRAKLEAYFAAKCGVTL